MLFSYNWLQSFFEQKLPKPEKLAELLEMHLFEVESLRKKKNDWVLDVDVLTNRLCDCGGHWGLAREIGAILGIKYKIAKTKLKENKKLEIKDFIEIEVQNPELCPRYSALVIKGVNVKSSPRWIQERLISCGLQPINNIVDATNYIMLETGQPLHAFDLDKIKDKDTGERNKKKIIIRCAKDGEKITTLEEKEYKLSKDALIIADKAGPLAIAGIKGGKEAGITKKTSNIVLESANFKNTSIYKTSKKLDIRTDASLRFSAGLDPNMTEFAINKVADLIQKIACLPEHSVWVDRKRAGDIITSSLIDFYPKKTFSKKIKLNIDYLKNLLGLDISLKDILKILENLEFKILSFQKKEILLSIPTFRQDISIEEDIIEEIGRIYGYINIRSVLPRAEIYPPSTNQKLIYQKKSKKFFKELGFLEVLNYSFLKEGWEDFFEKENLIEIEHPISTNTKYLRPSLIPNLVENIVFNQKYKKDLSFFELGGIFYKENQGLKEGTYLAGVITGTNKFLKLKGILELFFKNFGISKFSFELLNKDSRFLGKNFLNFKRASEIKIKNSKIGVLGEACQKIYFDKVLKYNLCIFEIDFDEVVGLTSSKKRYESLLKYPEVVRDISIICPPNTLVGEVMEIISSVGKKLVRDIQLFDIYEKENKKTLSFHIIYQSPRRSLSSKDITFIEKDIAGAIEKRQDFKVKR